MHSATSSKKRAGNHQPSIYTRENTMRTSAILFLSIIIIALGFLFFAPKTDSATKDAVSAEDFIKKFSTIQQFSTEASDLILIKSEDPEIKLFAQQIIAEYKNIGSDLESAMQTANMSLSIIPKNFDNKHKKDMDKLQSSNDLDRHYIDLQIKEYEAAIELFRKYSQNSSNAALKDFAGKTLPLLEERSSQANQLRSYM